MRGAVKTVTTLADIHKTLLKLDSQSNEHLAGQRDVLAKQARPCESVRPPKG